MRQRKILNILNETKTPIRSLSISAIPGNANIQLVKNFMSCMSAMDQLIHIELLNDEINDFQNDEKFGNILIDEFQISTTDATRMKKKLNVLVNRIDDLIIVLSRFIEPQHENTLSIKLHKMDHFNDFTVFASNFNKSILTPLQKLNVEVSLGDFEKGSRWINIIIEKKFGVKLIINIFKAAYEILENDLKKFKDTRDLIKNFKEQHSDNISEIEKFEQFISTHKDNDFEDKCQQIINDLFSKDDLTQEDLAYLDNIKDPEKNEIKISINKAINESIKFIEKGLEVHQSLDLPKDKKLQIPNYKELVNLHDMKHLSED